jgi:hypothetical protein
VAARGLPVMTIQWRPWRMGLCVWGTAGQGTSSAVVRRNDNLREGRDAFMGGAKLAE